MVTSESLVRQDPPDELNVGLRRVDWVRLLVSEGAIGAEAVGMGFRLPTTCPIPVATAAKLIARGTPFVARSASGPPSWRPVPQVHD